MPFFKNVVLKEPDSVLISSFMPKHRSLYSSSPWDPSLHSPWYGASSPRSCKAARNGNSSPAVLPAHHFVHEEVKRNCKYCEASAISVWYTGCESPVAAQCLCLRRVSAQWEKADDTAIMWNRCHPLQWLTRRHPTGFTSASKYISVICARLSRLFVSSSQSFSGWQQQGCVLFHRRWYGAGGSAFPLSICLGLWGVQNHSSTTAEFPLCTKWPSPFLWGRLSLLVEICCPCQEQVHLHCLKALKEHNWALICVCL